MSAIEKNRLLVVDDEEILCSCLATVFEGSGYRVETASDAETAWNMVLRESYDLVLLDIMLPGMDGITLLKRIREHDPRLPVVMLSAIDRSDTVVEAMRGGAWDYVRKPFDNAELLLTIANVLEEKRLKEEQRNLATLLPNRGLRQIISRSPQMKRVKEIIDQIADTDVTVLVHGETGVGKELVANRIHYLSPRRDEPFIKINCAALPENLLESELFGYERGAFTGALRSKSGKFEQAGAGTIFLDEIGEMGLPLQSKLLQVLQDKVCSRLGGTKEIPIHCRVLTATNRNLDEEIQHGRFRADLYYRLNVVNIYVPSLAERKDDIHPLVDHFLRVYNSRYSRRRKISYRTVEELVHYDWPGNIRELENWVRRYVILGSKAAWTRAAGGTGAAGESTAPDVSGLNRDEAVDIELLLAQHEVLPLKPVVRRMVVAEERQYLLRMLERVNYNKKKAARMLRISYKALLYKLKECNLDKVKLGGSA
ncbi:MAG: sigma-54-dependent Fis family transcriptional regulator [Deltaproteobacteria bacterium]|nr:sigma-54-dependent Fis family transcriptional regulator [Candidatus Anaeroferrophillacea bacterium]